MRISPKKTGGTGSWCVALVALASLAGDARGGEAFRKMSFDAALAEAAKSNKLVFLDFYTTWCGPCKEMDRTTFKDKWVTEWMAKETISLKLDAERELKLADKYKVEFYPTLVFLNSKGKEVERLLGYVTADEFRMAAKDLNKGVTALDRTQAELKKNPDDPRLRLDMGRMLARKSKYADALREFLWCLDEGAKKDPSFSEVRDGRLIDELLMLGEMYDPAQAALQKRSQAAERRLLDNVPESGDAAIFAGVSAMTMQMQRVLSAYDAAVARGKSSKSAEALYEYALPVLIELKRYQDIADARDVQSRTRVILEKGRKDLAKLKARGAEASEMERMMTVARTVSRMAQYYQVLLGLGRVDEAKTLAKDVLAFDDSTDTYHALAWEGFLSGKPIQDCLTYARTALKRTPDAEKANVTDTVARLMHVLGRSDEAINLCEQALAKADSDRDKWILSTCVSELRAAPDHTN